MKPVRIALVGCGGIARFYCQRYTQAENAQLVLLVDTNETLVKNMAEQLDGVRWSTNFQDCLADDIDMVDISTPNFLHADQAIAAIEAGKHVIIQKPLAPSIEEAERICEAARHTDKNVGMYMSTFNDPIVLDLKKMVTQGYLGEVVGIHCRNAHTGGLRTRPGTWRGDVEKTGGGSFIQLTIHNIDAVQWLLDSRVKSVMAFSHNTVCPNIGGDDYTVASCKFENGVLGTLESSYASEREYLAVYGTKGHFVLGGNDCLEVKLDQPFHGDVIAYTQAGVTERYPVIKSLDYYQKPNPYDQSIAFVRAIQEGKPAPISVEIGLYDLKVVKAVYKSAETGIREDVQ